MVWAGPGQNSMDTQPMSKKKDPRPGSHQKPDPEPALAIINNLHDYKPNQPSI